LTLFIAFVAPFGGFLFSGLKRAMRNSKSSAITVFKGGVMDRMECIIITGCFMLIYMSMLVGNVELPTASNVLNMASYLSEEAQKELYYKLKEDLLKGY